MCFLVAEKWSGSEFGEGAHIAPENSPLLLFFCNLQAGKEEGMQSSASPPVSCVLYPVY